MEKEKVVDAKTRAEWRKWLEENHKKESKVSLLIHKKHTGKPSMSHRESMEEAICFGWIDTTIKKIDEDTYIRRFSKRSKNSRWSSNTLSYAKKLIEEGRMTSEGLKFYEEGLSKPTIDDGIPKNPDVPKDLKKALEKKSAEETFGKIAPSVRRTYLRWLFRAKLPETKRKELILS